MAVRQAYFSFGSGTRYRNSWLAIAPLVLAALLALGCDGTDAGKNGYILRWQLKSGETLELKSASSKVKKLVDACWDGKEIFCPEIRDEKGRVLMNDVTWQVGMSDDAKRKQYERLRD